MLSEKELASINEFRIIGTSVTLKGVKERINLWMGEATVGMQHSAERFRNTT